jgi:hypothetical protein
MTCRLIYGLKLKSDDFWELYPNQYRELLLREGALEAVGEGGSYVCLYHIHCFEFGDSKVQAHWVDFEFSNDDNKGDNSDDGNNHENNDDEADADADADSDGDDDGAVCIVGVEVNQCSGHYSSFMTICSAKPEHITEWSKFLNLNPVLQGKTPNLYLHCDREK